MASTCKIEPTGPTQWGTEWRVTLHPTKCTYTLRGMTGTIIVPAGFVWNGASIPKAFRGIIGGPHDCEFERASKVHDYLYWSRKATRADADEILYQILLQDGCDPAKARLIWGAVRLFASSNYGAKPGEPFRIVGER